MGEWRRENGCDLSTVEPGRTDTKIECLHRLFLCFQMPEIHAYKIHQEAEMFAMSEGLTMSNRVLNGYHLNFAGMTTSDRELALNLKVNINKWNIKINKRSVKGDRSKEQLETKVGNRVSYT